VSAFERVGSVELDGHVRLPARQLLRAVPPVHLERGREGAHLPRGGSAQTASHQDPDLPSPSGPYTFSPFTAWRSSSSPSLPAAAAAAAAVRVGAGTNAKKNGGRGPRPRAPAPLPGPPRALGESGSGRVPTDPPSLRPRTPSAVAHTLADLALERRSRSLSRGVHASDPARAKMLDLGCRGIQFIESNSLVIGFDRSA